MGRIKKGRFCWRAHSRISFWSPNCNDCIHMVSAGEDKWMNKAGYYEQKEYPESTGFPKVVIIWQCSTSRFTDPTFFFQQEGRCGAQTSELATEENVLEAHQTGNRSLLAIVNLTILRFPRHQLRFRFLPCSLAWRPGQAARMSSAVWLNGRDSLRSLEEIPGGVCEEAAKPFAIKEVRRQMLSVRLPRIPVMSLNPSHPQVHEELMLLICVCFKL